MKDKKKTPHDLAHLSGIGFQLVAIIGIFVGLGYWLDKKYQTQRPWFTLGFSLVGLVVGMTFMIREFNKKS